MIAIGSSGGGTVPDATDHTAECPDANAQCRTAGMVLEAAEQREVQTVGLCQQFTDGATRAEGRDRIDDPQPADAAATDGELGAEHLQPGAYRQHNGAPCRSRAETAVCGKKSICGLLRYVFTSAQQVDVSKPRNRISGGDCHHLHADLARFGPASENQGVSPIAIEAEKCRVDVHDRQR
jgi:hypothetical protein